MMANGYEEKATQLVDADRLQVKYIAQKIIGGFAEEEGGMKTVCTYCPFIRTLPDSRKAWNILYVVLPLFKTLLL